MQIKQLKTNWINVLFSRVNYKWENVLTIEDKKWKIHDLIENKHNGILEKIILNINHFEKTASNVRERYEIDYEIS